MFYDPSVFHKLESIAPTAVKLGDNSTANCTQIGEVVLHTSDGRRLRLSQVLYVPSLAINLLSVSQLAKKGIMTSFTKTGCALIDSDDGNCLLAEAIITSGGLYVITKAVRRASLAARSLSATEASSSSKSLAPLSKDMKMHWHALLGLVGFETVNRAAHTGATTGIDLTAHTKHCNCHTCLLQKASRRPSKGSLVKRASVIGDVIHTDLAGPMPPTICCYKYVQSFIDGRTRLKYIYLLKKKSDAGGALRDFIVKFEREHDCLVKSVHADNAAKFTGGDFNSCLRDQGIKFTSSAPYSPESNGLAENFNKVLFARVRYLLDHSGMDKVMWEKLPTTPYTYSTSRRQDLLSISLRMKLHMALCLMSASFACLAVSPLQHSHIPRSSTTRQCALPTWVTLGTKSIVYCCQDPTSRYSSRPL
jgi:hypothetical protein